MVLVEERICDRRVLKLIRQWLRAGVMEEGEVRKTLTGTPQGGVISPLLANIYLHLLDRLWAAKCGSLGVLIRYADDCAPRRAKGLTGPAAIAAEPMRAGPSEPACRSRFQTTSGGCGQKPWS
jgi:hypothetical protein